MSWAEVCNLSVSRHYSPKCLEEEFREVRGSKVDLIRITLDHLGGAEQGNEVGDHRPSLQTERAKAASSCDSQRPNFLRILGRVLGYYPPSSGKAHSDA
jgi:hypothetical protein